MQLAWPIISLMLDVGTASLWQSVYCNPAAGIYHTCLIHAVSFCRSGQGVYAVLRQELTVPL
jgi:hypothetical protein